MKDELIATQTLAPLAKSNPEMIGLARSVELKIFDMLVSNESERYQPKDERRLNAIRHNMVYAAAQAIFNAEPERATGIGMQFFRTFKTTSGAYTNFRSFMKQVHRTLSTFKPRS